MKRITSVILFIALSLSLSATTWFTHFAYNSVNQIAAGGGMVYGASSGALFAIDAQTEQITTYSHQNGMHGNNVVCIQWLEPIHALMIMYSDGKMDILSNGQFRFVPDLYNKSATFSKLCHSVTLKDSLAYMAMDYGIQTFHIRKQEFIDTYFIGPQASEVPIYSIAFANDKIYAAAEDVLYTASMDDNLVDYSYWSTLALPRSGRIQGLASAAGTLYLLQGNTCYRLLNGQWQAIDNNTYQVLNVLDNTIYPADYPAASYNGIWLAAGADGILRLMETGEQLTYHLDGPLTNTPYRLHADQGQLFMLAGGRWATQDSRPGNVMRYDGHSWHNITQQQIVGAVGDYCLDLMNVAVDPNDPAHYFVTSYGTGMFEFRNDQCITRWDPSNSIIEAAASNNPAKYTRLDGAVYDAQGNLWVMNAGNITYSIVIFTPNGEQYGLNALNPDGSRYKITTAGQLIFDNQRPNHVWALSNRSSENRAGLVLIDTKGTLSNPDDDRNISRTSWTDPEGNELTTDAGYVIRQAPHGDLWFGTGKGLWIFPANTDYFESDECHPVQLIDEFGQMLFEEEAVKDIVFDNLGRAWVAGSNTGVYVISETADSILAHFSMDNSALPSNSILSLAFDEQNTRMYIGSALGLVSCTNISVDLQAEEDKSQLNPIDMGSMMQWSMHFAYTDIADIRLSDSHVYALSEGSLCAIDKDDESIAYYSKLNGLNGSSIHSIAYDNFSHNLLIAYDNGMFDLLSDDGAINMVADLYLKQMSTPKQVKDITFLNGKAYMAMHFGIMVLNMNRREISDTYYIGDLGSELSVDAVTIVGDSIYASAGNRFYRAHLRANLVDYSAWQSQTLSGNISQLISHNDALYMLMDSVLYRNFEPIITTERISKVSANNRHLLAFTREGRVCEVTGTTLTELSSLAAYAPHCAVKDGSEYWLGTQDGILHLDAYGATQKYQPDGPSSNMPYNLTTYGSQVWGVPGGRWTSGYLRQGQIMHFNGSTWDNLTYSEICRRLGTTISLYDFGHIAVDPADPTHFYAASFGSGLIEFRPDGTAKRYNYDNSPLVSLLNDNKKYRYCRVDALAFDAERNLWLTNTGSQATNIHVIDPQGVWHSFNLYKGTQRIVLNTVSKIMVDKRNPDYKWIASARDQAALILHYDNGTPLNNYDDRVAMQTTFIDQDKKSITLDRLNTIAQDHNGDLWLGTNEGILVIDAATDLFRSNACRRLKISRHDGTNLADYLLGTEQINTIVFAGGNRIWIGTEVSGAYLVHMVTKEGIYEPEIIAHFTTVNSPMPSDCVLSIALNEENGEVYIGTSKGLVSYRGDATRPAETFSNAYVYPNPVRPNYEGVITINGLMDNTTVYIADAAGNVVCRTHSNGGTAVWDGRTQSGKRAHSGVYSVYCNTADGKQHTVIKLLLMY